MHRGTGRAFTQQQQQQQQCSTTRALAPSHTQRVPSHCSAIRPLGAPSAGNGSICNIICSIRRASTARVLLARAAPDGSGTAPDATTTTAAPQQHQQRQAEEPVLTWQGSDEFTPLGDRKALPPLPLPPITSSKRVVLVRHGQSTWNAEGRIQGSSNFAVLTPKGEAQAQTTRQMVSGEAFCALYHSPLERAARTAQVIWGDRGGPVSVLPSLREIDLYSFQGLLKEQGKARFGDAFRTWQKRSDEFEIDGHPPVRELWYRASLAWREILLGDGSSSSGSSQDSGDSSVSGGEAPHRTLLVVAHNAVNQALIGTALGLPPSYFRRVVQSNAAVSVLDFQPGEGEGAPPRVTVDRLNQSPGPPFSPDSTGRKAAARVVLVRHCATLSTDGGVLLGSRDEPLSSKGQVHAVKVGELLMDMRVDKILSSPMQRATATAELVAQLQALAAEEEEDANAANATASAAPGSGAAEAAEALLPPREVPEVEVLASLASPGLGSWEGSPAAQLRRQGALPGDAEPLDSLWQRTAEAWAEITRAAAEAGSGNSGSDSGGGGGGGNVVVVAHALVHAALVCHCLGLPRSALQQIRKDPGGVTIIDFPDGAGEGGKGVVRCLNYTAHLGRWAVPITRDDYDAVCGIDGCF